MTNKKKKKVSSRNLLIVTHILYVNKMKESSRMGSLKSMMSKTNQILTKDPRSKNSRNSTNQ